MKNILVIFFSIICLPTQAQNTTLIATRNNVDNEYSVNTRFTVHYNDNKEIKKVKGYFKGAIGDSLIQFTKKLKSADTFTIALHKIEILKKTSTIKRLKFTAAFVGLGLSGALLADALSSKDTASIGKHNFSYIYAIPILGGALYYLYAIPATLITDKLNEHKKINNWTFRISK